MEQLPLWFLFISLALPRVALLIAYLTNGLEAYSLHGWVPAGLAILFPRVLVLIMIFIDRVFRCGCSCTQSLWSSCISRQAKASRGN